MFRVLINNRPPSSVSASLRYELPDDRHELDRDFHHGVCSCLVCRLVFGDRFDIALRYVMLENAPNARLVPANGRL